MFITIFPFKLAKQIFIRNKNCNFRRLHIHTWHTCLSLKYLIYRISEQTSAYYDGFEPASLQPHRVEKKTSKLACFYAIPDVCASIINCNQTGFCEVHVPLFVLYGRQQWNDILPMPHILREEEGECTHGSPVCNCIFYNINNKNK